VMPIGSNSVACLGETASGSGLELLLIIAHLRVNWCALNWAC
jgi:hypothetical protein